MKTPATTPASLPPDSQEKRKQSFQHGVQHGCPRDQPGGPKTVGCGGARGGGQYLDHYRAILDYIRA